MAKKHQHTREAKGKRYTAYRASTTYKGVQIRISAKDKADWERRVSARKLEIDSNFLPSDPNMTVAQLAKLYLDDALASLRPKTIEERESKLRLYVLPRIGHLKLRHVKSDHIEGIYEIAQEVSASTLEHVHKVTNGLLNFAIENEYVLTDNPITKGLLKRVKRFVASSKETTKSDWVGLSLEDIDYVLLESRGKPHEIMTHWQLLCGLRVGEALGVRWEDIDLGKELVNVNVTVHDMARARLEGSKYAEGHGPIVAPPKTARSRREIPLQEGTVALLAQTPAKKRHGYVYSTPDGTPFFPSNYRKQVFNLLRKKVGLDTMQTHDLRKAFGSVLLTEGVDIMTVSAWMGHSSPEVTMRIYAKILPEAEKRHRHTIGKALLR